ncbi:matrixin family metalloprotease [Sulfuriroseicoccus oceanibius]|uniref:Matrixin family metalloprotease n=1 Tax=Sulfuriroseicoccus oceanibius TaxID=2707525 RepID=A0A6B3LA52_9BACT|nr:matrixin family metalloprotease [Sulfuriroseicoccus oceanibius]QQL45409.1 matrixin family metalloprotease [Sulfuriroseicoccus oceanibius]
MKSRAFEKVLMTVVSSALLIGCDKHEATTVTASDPSGPSSEPLQQTLAEEETNIWEANSAPDHSGCSCGCGASSEAAHAVADQRSARQAANRQTWGADAFAHLIDHHEISEKAATILASAIPHDRFISIPVDLQQELIDYADFTQVAPTRYLPSLCWHEATPAIKRQLFHDVRSAAISSDPQTALDSTATIEDRWLNNATDGPAGPQGTVITLTWSIIPDGTIIPNRETFDPDSTSNLIAKLNETYGTHPSSSKPEDQPWFPMFVDAFAEWSEESGVRFVYEPNDDGAIQIYTSEGAGQLGVRGDIRIGGKYIDGDAGTLAYNWYPDYGDMVIDTGDGLIFNGNVNSQFTRNVIAHELGHGLGFGHIFPRDKTKLMEALATSAFAGPQFDDVLTIQSSYGDSYERHASGTDNESTARATDIGSVSSGNAFTSQNASIANASDVDTYRFTAGSTGSATVQIVPASESYMVGPTEPEETLFEAALQQDLQFKVFAADGSTVLHSVNDGATGSTESVTFNASSVGADYYVQVLGDGSDSPQVYQLSVDIEAIAPSLGLSNYQLISESCAPANQTVDQGELITISVDLTNTGSLTATDTAVTLEAATNLVRVTSSDTLGDLAPGGSATAYLQFRHQGDNGSTPEIVITASASNGSPAELRQSFTIGTPSELINEGFETLSVGSLPAGWSAATTGATQWAVTGTSPNTGTKALFCSDSSGDTDATVTLPSILLPADQSATLQFSHQFAFEPEYDGGVLEISIDGGAWQDWVTAGGTFTQGGYVDAIRNPSSASIAGRQAWSGFSNGYQQVTATFPISAQGKPVQVRWLLSTDRNKSEQGWWIDDVTISGGYTSCIPSLPTLTATATDNEASELDLANHGQIEITASETVGSDLAVAYALSGTATNGSDITTLAGTATIASGNTKTTVDIAPIRDSLAEGTETLTLTLSTDSTYEIGSPSAASVTITDLPVDEWRFATFPPAAPLTGDSDDYDRDGVKNLLEYALGTDPTSMTQAPTVEMVTTGNGPEMQLRFKQLTGLADISYQVETSDTLESESWTTSGVVLNYGDTDANGMREVTASIPVGSGPRFLRLQIVRTVTP